MRRTTSAALVALVTAFTLLPAASPAGAQETTPSPVAAPAETGAETGAEAGDAAGDVPTTEAEAQAALESAEEIIEGDGVEARADGTEVAAETAPVEASMALRDLFAAVPLLRGKDRSRAEAILARPTDGPADPQGFGYDVTAPATRSCSTDFCVHYVTRTADAAPSAAWVSTTLSTMSEVGSFVVGKLGYRRPLSDAALANNGGDGRFDIYLKDLGSSGIYGYCAPEGRRGVQASAYCVLDNDFATSQYGAAPTNVLRVTAAHEYFHAVQYAYDATDDRWMMESTAAWIEERFADAINDNRQYLRYGQVRRPGQSLDTYSRGTGFQQYGNWAFWEHLGGKHGTNIVRKVWENAAPRNGRNAYSLAAIDTTLRRKGGLKKAYRAFVTANLTARRSYPEGAAWPTPQTSRSWRLSTGRRTAKATLRVNHLASSNVTVRPNASLGGKRWKLRVRVDGPGRVTAPAAVVVVNRPKGKVLRKVVRLNAKGVGSTTVPFGRATARSVSVALINASTRTRCGAQNPNASRTFSCYGKPRDDRSRFAVSVSAVRR